MRSIKPLAGARARARSNASSASPSELRMSTAMEQMQPFCGLPAHASSYSMGGLRNGAGSASNLAPLSTLRISHAPSLPGGPPLRCAHAPSARPLNVAPPSSSPNESEWTRARVVSPQLFSALQPRLERRKVPSKRPSSLPSLAPPPPAQRRQEVKPETVVPTRAVKPQPKPPTRQKLTRADAAARARVLLNEAMRNGPPCAVTADAVMRKTATRAAGVPLVAVRFVWKATVGVRTVFLYGSFNSWETPIALYQDTNHGAWSRVVRLPAGTYWYRYVVDGRWVVDSSRRVVQRSEYGKVNEVSIHYPLR